MALRQAKHHVCCRSLLGHTFSIRTTKMKPGNVVPLLVATCLVYLTHHAHAWPLLNPFHSRGSLGRYVTNGVNQGGASAQIYETDEQIKAAMNCPSTSDHNHGFVFWCEMQEGPADTPAATTRMREISRILHATNIWDCFPETFICNRGGDWWVNFIDRVSGIYTDHVLSTGRQVYVITDQYDNGLQWPHTVFGRVERPTLEQGGLLQVTLVDGRSSSNVRGKIRSINALYDSAAPSSSNKQADKATAVDITNDIPYRLNWEGFGDDPGGSCPIKYAVPGPAGYGLPLYTPGL